MLRFDMRMTIASALALALTLSSTAHAGDWSPGQDDAMQKIIELSNKGALDQAVTLASQEFARADASKGYRRAVARQGKAAALKLFDRDRATAHAAATTALCVAVDFMRTYQAELIESDDDRRKIPPEVTRLEALAMTAAAPCAPPPAPTSTPPQPPVVAAKPAPGPAVEGPAFAPPIRLAPQRSRARVGVGVGLVTVGTGLLVGMTAVFVGRHGFNEKIDALRGAGEQANRDLTTQEIEDISSWDARYVQLERTGAVLGGLAAISVVAAIVVFVMPKQRAVSQARVLPVGAGVHIKF